MSPISARKEEAGAFQRYSLEEVRALLETLSEDRDRYLRIRRLAGAFLRRLKRPPSGADDLVQEAILRSWTGRRTWSRALDLERNMASIMRSLAWNALRQDVSVVSANRDADGQVAEPADLNAGPEDVVLYSDLTAHLIEQILAALPVEGLRREVFMLQTLDLLPEEISEILQLDKRTLETIQRNIRKVRAVMKADRAI
jgi:DNA-directed RNA polymerase specialized sigma24 family protein